ncbi:ArsR family transcriptional regulator [Papillibacter cinnamivorans DSM 12816]|uniref:ArsR family transcriptional regulator n=2 Tax=Papillibacter TaxID=100175 RepID=A0A1W2CPF2_9FIRM|nr:ArsR family transcriptional regulator [Papillibacter cinnamivorans DSM 12816]
MAHYDQDLIDSSGVFRALSHPARLCVVNKLTTTVLTVGQMQECLGMSQSNVSQHLSILKSRGIIKGERIGSEVFYSLADDRMKDLVKIFLND